MKRTQRVERRSLWILIGLVVCSSLSCSNGFTPSSSSRSSLPWIDRFSFRRRGRISVLHASPAVPVIKGDERVGRRGRGRRQDKQRTRRLFQDAKQLEKAGRWNQAVEMFRNILKEDPSDSHSHLALARLEARREQSDRFKQQKTYNNNNKKPESKARAAFENGTHHCPNSIHIWQAWARFEESCSNTDRARELFEQALQIDQHNPYVCHAYGLMEKKLGNEVVSPSLIVKSE